MLALWYFPVLMVGCGIAMVIFDSRRIHKAIRKLRGALRRHHPPPSPIDTELETRPGEQGIQPIDEEAIEADSRASGISPMQIHRSSQSQEPTSTTPLSTPASHAIKIPYSIVVGVIILALFVTVFVVIMVLRSVLTSAPTLFRFFANILLAGTIIFGSFHSLRS